MPIMHFRNRLKIERNRRRRKAEAREALPGQVAWVAATCLAVVAIVFLMKIASDDRPRAAEQAQASAKPDCRQVTLCDGP